MPSARFDGKASYLGLLTTRSEFTSTRRDKGRTTGELVFAVVVGLLLLSCFGPCTASVIRSHRRRWPLESRISTHPSSGIGSCRVGMSSLGLAFGVTFHGGLRCRRPLGLSLIRTAAGETGGATTLNDMWVRRPGRRSLSLERVIEKPDAAVSRGSLA